MSTSIPVSQLIRKKEELAEDEQSTIRSREEWRKAKELEEARKAGTAPAAVDEEGKDINPHIPQYIATAPWYVGASGPTLKHQREPEEHKKTFDPLSLRYLRGAERLVQKVVTKYRKGACENCGALTHVKKDCLERPRKIGAKFSGKDIASDELPQPEINFSFDGKRDRWNGYDPNDYVSVVDEFQKVEEAKRQLKAEKLSTGTGGIELSDGMVLDEDVPEEDEDKYVDDVDMPGTKVDSKQRITVRNLRIREDTAKYLRNLDPNSAYYDPKTRSMRDNPYKDVGKKAEEVDYAGENFVRFTGDTTKHAKAQLFAWEASERGVDVHLLAEPTKLELLHKTFETKKEEFKGSLTKDIIDKYGGEEHLDAPPKSLLLAQTEDYIEYSRQGKIIKGGEKVIVRSKYEEDVYPNNHTSIFGSFWKDGNWGYACCHSFIKNSYCVGLMNIRDDIEEAAAAAVAFGRKESSNEENDSTAKISSTTPSKETNKNETKKSEGSSSSSSDDSSSSSGSSSSDSSEDEDEEEIKKLKLKKALDAETRRMKEAEGDLDDRKRKYNSRYETKQLSEAEIEAWHMLREREDDPMAQFLSKKPRK